MKYANLHLHSTHSDSKMTPTQLVLIGKSLGYQALALTDHETDSGNKEFLTICKREGIRAVYGAEFYGSAKNGVRVHLTALDFDPEEPALRALIKRLVDDRCAHTRACFEKGVENRYINGVTWNDIVELSPDDAWLCIDSVMAVMKLKKAVKAGYNWDEFRTNVFKTPEAKAAEPTPPTAEEIIRTVRKAGGVIALAHPNAKWMELMDELVGYGLNGIEVSHPNIEPHICYKAAEAAEKYNLYRCGGTDHDGAMSGVGGIRARPVYNGITEEEFTTLIERRLGR